MDSLTHLVLAEFLVDERLEKWDFKAPVAVESLLSVAVLGQLRRFASVFVVFSLVFRLYCLCRCLKEISSRYAYSHS